MRQLYGCPIFQMRKLRLQDVKQFAQHFFHLTSSGTTSDSTQRVTESVLHLSGAPRQKNHNSSYKEEKLTPGVLAPRPRYSGSGGQRATSNPFGTGCPFSGFLPEYRPPRVPHVSSGKWQLSWGLGLEVGQLWRASESKALTLDCVSSTKAS